jgi:hypothetical protein
MKPGLASPLFRPTPPRNSSFWAGISVRVDAFMIGSAKCATKWIAQSLRDSGQVLLPGEGQGLTQRADETGAYFNRFFQGQRRAPDLFTIDYGNTYMLDPLLPESIRSKFGSVPIIFAYRDPVERAFSHYLMDRVYGDLDADVSFRESVCSPKTFSYFNFGLYRKNLAPYVEAFGPDKIVVIDVDAVEHDPERCVRKLLDFLDLNGAPAHPVEGCLNSWEQFHFEHLGVDAPDKPKLDDSDRNWLWGFYQEDHERFLRELDRFPHVIRA